MTTKLTKYGRGWAAAIDALEIAIDDRDEEECEAALSELSTLAEKEREQDAKMIPRAGSTRAERLLQCARKLLEWKLG